MSRIASIAFALFAATFAASAEKDPTLDRLAALMAGRFSSEAPAKTATPPPSSP